MTGLILITALNAQTKQEQTADTLPDSVFIFRYPPCIQMFKENYQGNRWTLRQFRQSLSTFARGRDTLYVNGYSGECTAGSRNLRTAYYRCNNLKGYLINYYGLRERDFKTVNLPCNHPDLGDIVTVSFSPFPARGQSAEAPPAGEDEPEQTAPAVAAETDTAPTAQPSQGSAQTSQAPAQQAAQDSARHPSAQQQPPNLPASPEPCQSPPSSGRYISLKTNLASWAGTIMNVAADVQVSGHISVELPVLWCPWYVGGKHAVKTFTVQPEARWWLRHPGAGHFLGVHAHVGWYSVRWNRDRYQDTGRPLLGAGISYGYLLPFNAHWAGEFTLGAGYANMKYDTYYNIDNGARIDTRTKNYWGITRVGLSVVYRFNLKK